jgi:RNA polymerase sigma-70 factor (ECF subfamily)
MKGYLSDAEILELLNRGGHYVSKAIEALYDQNKSLLQSILKSSFKSEKSKTSEDIIWETMEAFINNVNKGSFSLQEGISIAAYLRVISKNLMLKYVSSENARSLRQNSFSLEIEESEPDVSHLIIEHEKWETYLQIFEKAGKNCKRILQMVYGLGYSIKELAKELIEEGIFENEQVVRNAKSKCLKNVLNLITV